MRELSSLSATSTASTTASSIRNTYGRSISSAGKYSSPGRPSRPSLTESSPGIMEMASGSLESDIDSNALVTMPETDIVPANGSLTSPNLVHSINPGMSLASATSFAKMQSSYKSSERKESSTSVSTMLGAGDGQMVTNAQSASSSSRMDSSATAGLAIGHDGQAVITGSKMQSSESHESSSSSQRKVTANGEVTSLSSHQSSHTSSKKSSSITMTSSGSFARSLLTSSQVCSRFVRLTS